MRTIHQVARTKIKKPQLTIIEHDVESWASSQ